MDTLQGIQEKNTLPIVPVSDSAFEAYGRVLDTLETEDWVSYMQEHTQVPDVGNTYVASVPEMEVSSQTAPMEWLVFGGMETEVGYCNGRNTKLNCLEYHKSSEVDIAVTDQVLLLALPQDLVGNTLDSKLVKAFFVPAGTTVELHPRVLHFSPCAVSPHGFKTVIILPKGTNTPLEMMDTQDTEGKMIWMRNKWLLSCPGTVQAEKGAWIGISGKNYQINS